MKQPAPLPAMAMIDTPEDGRFYFIPPVPPGVYCPAIRVFRGVIRPCYPIPSQLGSGSVYSEGTEMVCKRLRELQGIRKALGMMGELWQGVLDSHPGAHDDLPKQKRLVKGLVGPPETAFALIEKSGILGRENMPKKAPDFIRNVMALAHWKAIWQIRNRRRNSDPGGLAWDAAAALVNEICHKAFPDWQDREWRDFTGDTLKSFADRHCLDPRVRL